MGVRMGAEIFQIVRAMASSGSQSIFALSVSDVRGEESI